MPMRDEPAILSDLRSCEDDQPGSSAFYALGAVGQAARDALLLLDRFAGQHAEALNDPLFREARQHLDDAAWIRAARERVANEAEDERRREREEMAALCGDCEHLRRHHFGGGRCDDCGCQRFREAGCGGCGHERAAHGVDRPDGHCRWCDCPGFYEAKAAVRQPAPEAHGERRTGGLEP